MYCWNCEILKSGLFFNWIDYNEMDSCPCCWGSPGCRVMNISMFNHQIPYHWWWSITSTIPLVMVNHQYHTVGDVQSPVPYRLVVFNTTYPYTKKKQKKGGIPYTKKKKAVMTFDWMGNTNLQTMISREIWNTLMLPCRRVVTPQMKLEEVSVWKYFAGPTVVKKQAQAEKAFLPNIRGVMDRIGILIRREKVNQFIHNRAMQSIWELLK